MAENAEPSSRPLGIVRRFIGIASGFWLGSQSRRAWLLSLAFLAFVFISLGFQIAITFWNRYFFNALESRDGVAVWSGVQLIVLLTLAAAASGFTFNQVNLRLRLRWREWLTGHLVTGWLGDKRFYHLSIAKDAPSNPEYRIAEDIRVATEMPLDIVFGLSSAVLSAFTFIGVLWLVGGSIGFSVLGWSVALPGYMVLGVIAYSSACSALMALLGRPLITSVETKNTAEAAFRYEVTRVRENAESIALVSGDEAERRRLRYSLDSLAKCWVQMIEGISRMTGVSNANATVAPVIPLLLASPKYLAGQLTLGEVMQLAAAFLIVHQALNWLADNSVRIAEWIASADRVVELAEALGRTGQPARPGDVGRITIGTSNDDAIHVRGLSIANPDGEPLIIGPEISIARGERVLVQGQSGTGKNTLVRTLAGLWPWGSGSIYFPSDSRIAFMLQRPFMPLGSLGEALCYPHSSEGISRSAMVRALERCDLGHLVRRLDEEQDWSKALSGGELQRFGFARLLVSPPTIVVLDEATSALDDFGEDRVMQLFHDELEGVTVIGVGRRTQHERYYDRKISLSSDRVGPSSARASSVEMTAGY